MICFDRRLLRGDRHRRKQPVLPPRVLQAERQLALVGFHAERQRAPLAGRKDVTQQRKSGRLAVEIERLFEKQNGKLFLILEVLQQSSDLELVWRDSSLNAHKVVRQPFLKIVEESSQIHVHVPITRGVHISNGVLEYLAALALSRKGMTPSLQKLLRSSKPANCTNALCV